eukprot:15320425-Alexandrium_andersonii.AAC.1
MDTRATAGADPARRSAACESQRCRGASVPGNPAQELGAPSFDRQWPARNDITAAGRKREVRPAPQRGRGRRVV